VSVTTAVFYLLAAVTVGSALGVALSHSIIYSAFALMGSLLGVAAIFVLLGADFLGAVQLLVYVGGILVLTLFAVMLTHRIGDMRVSNRAVGRGPGLVLVALVFGWMVHVARQATWVQGTPGAPAPTTYGIGEVLLTDYVLPFEVASVVLLAALIGAVMVSRKEVKA
jgi:NADH-quinone oxidoreductase subunit J